MHSWDSQAESSNGREATPARSVISVQAAIVVLAVASLLPLAALVLVDAGYPGDDALISLTYAKNLARGDGFVFNHPPPVLGTTSPAFTLAVAAVAAVLPATPTTVALWLSVLCWLGLVWSFFLLRSPFGLEVGQSVAIGAVLAATGWVAHLSMEAYPFALLLVVTTAAVLGRRPFVAGLCGGLLFLMRGEGVLYAAILGAAILFAELRGSSGPGRSPTLSFVAGSGLPIVVWAAYAWPTFGVVLPNTLAAKIAQVASGLWAPFPVRLLEDWLPGWRLGPGPGWLATVIGYVLVVAGLVVVVRRVRAMLFFPIWGVAYVAGYWWLGVPGYPWYRLPIDFVLAVLAGLGLEAVVRAVARRPGWLRWRDVTAAGLVVCVVVGTAAGTARTLARSEIADKDRSYRRLAGWLASNADPSARVAYMEVGYLGYYTDLGIVDLVGLVSPDMVAHVVDRDFARGFWVLQPEYLVHLEGSRFTGSIVENPIFPRAYAPVVTLEGIAGRSLTVFAKKATLRSRSADPPTGS